MQREGERAAKCSPKRIDPQLQQQSGVVMQELS